MEQWQKDLTEIIETVADEVELFFLGMSEMVDAFFDLTEEITEQVHSTFITEVDQYLQDLAEPIFSEAYWDLEDIMSDLDPGFPYEVEPTREQNSACIGCNNYHGQVYGGNLLVCAMHPHGWDDESCPDWERE
ncbi:hypothetical protein I8751_23105 [Nostocaceae cyanobacterium CENA357]|uniref:Uncharacterized protein n=1 Tax=Atlanticothrix silvestris CENA357 TaxID=1725252 RepID=A0A8J7L3Q9_9CYAN|nr:hypothetical protein [Atlanticothrix silvestris]MBH8555185.1 hypothetical protein [Atlanticothrix silvestris CENA357]